MMSRNPNASGGHHYHRQEDPDDRRHGGVTTTTYTNLTSNSTSRPHPVPGAGQIEMHYHQKDTLEYEADAEAEPLLDANLTKTGGNDDEFPLPPMGHSRVIGGTPSSSGTSATTPQTAAVTPGWKMKAKKSSSGKGHHQREGVASDGRRALLEGKGQGAMYSTTTGGSGVPAKTTPQADYSQTLLSQKHKVSLMENYPVDERAHKVDVKFYKNMMQGIEKGKRNTTEGENEGNQSTLPQISAAFQSTPGGSHSARVVATKTGELPPLVPGARTARDTSTGSPGKEGIASLGGYPNHQLRTSSREQTISMVHKADDGRVLARHTSSRTQKKRHSKKNVERVVDLNHPEVDALLADRSAALVSIFQEKLKQQHRYFTKKISDLETTHTMALSKKHQAQRKGADGSSHMFSRNSTSGADEPAMKGEMTSQGGEGEGNFSEEKITGSPFVSSTLGLQTAAMYQSQITRLEEQIKALQLSLGQSEKLHGEATYHLLEEKKKSMDQSRQVEDLLVKVQELEKLSTASETTSTDKSAPLLMQPPPPPLAAVTIVNTPPLSTPLDDLQSSSRDEGGSTRTNVFMESSLGAGGGIEERAAMSTSPNAALGGTLVMHSESLSPTNQQIEATKVPTTKDSGTGSRTPTPPAAVRETQHRVDCSTLPLLPDSGDTEAAFTVLSPPAHPSSSQTKDDANSKVKKLPHSPPGKPNSRGPSRATSGKINKKKSAVEQMVEQEDLRSSDAKSSPIGTGVFEVEEEVSVWESMIKEKKESALAEIRKNHVVAETQTLTSYESDQQLMVALRGKITELEKQLKKTKGLKKRSSRSSQDESSLKQKTPMVVSSVEDVKENTAVIDFANPLNQPSTNTTIQKGELDSLAGEESDRVPTPTSEASSSDVDDEASDIDGSLSESENSRPTTMNDAGRRRSLASQGSMNPGHQKSPLSTQSLSIVVPPTGGSVHTTPRTSGLSPYNSSSKSRQQRERAAAAEGGAPPNPFAAVDAARTVQIANLATGATAFLLIIGPEAKTAAWTSISQAAMKHPKCHILLFDGEVAILTFATPGDGLHFAFENLSRHLGMALDIFYPEKTVTFGNYGVYEPKYIRGMRTLGTYVGRGEIVVPSQVYRKYLQGSSVSDLLILMRLEASLHSSMEEDDLYSIHKAGANVAHFNAAALDGGAGGYLAGWSKRVRQVASGKYDADAAAEGTPSPHNSKRSRKNKPMKTSSGLSSMGGNPLDVAIASAVANASSSTNGRPKLRSNENSSASLNIAEGVSPTSRNLSPVTKTRKGMASSARSPTASSLKGKGSPGSWALDAHPSGLDVGDNSSQVSQKLKLVPFNWANSLFSTVPNAHVVSYVWTRAVLHHQPTQHQGGKSPLLGRSPAASSLNVPPRGKSGLGRISPQPSPSALSLNAMASPSSQLVDLALQHNFDHQASVSATQRVLILPSAIAEAAVNQLSETETPKSRSSIGDSVNGRRDSGLTLLPKPPNYQEAEVDAGDHGLGTATTSGHMGTKSSSAYQSPNPGVPRRFAVSTAMQAFPLMANAGVGPAEDIILREKPTQTFVKTFRNKGCGTEGVEVNDDETLGDIDLMKSEVSLEESRLNSSTFDPEGSGSTAAPPSPKSVAASKTLNGSGVPKALMERQAVIRAMTCYVCKELFEDVHVLHPCGHMYCLKCCESPKVKQERIVEGMKELEYRCPRSTCRQVSLDLPMALPQMNVAIDALRTKGFFIRM